MTKKEEIEDRLVSRRTAAFLLGYKSLISVRRLEKAGRLKLSGFKPSPKYLLSDVLKLVNGTKEDFK